jgi:SH3-like domain-containing protein
MRSCGCRYANRLLLLLGVVIALGVSGPIHAAAPAGQDGEDIPSKVDPKHRAKVEVRKPGEQTGKVQAKGAPGKGQNAKGEQKGHVPPPVAVVPPPVAPPPPEAAATEPSEPAPKLPRFAALKTDETNMRKGPGQRYPIDWVYQRHDLPVEVEREYDVWRYVRDPDGTQGWVHQVTLSDRRTFMIKGKDAMLRSAANDTASPVAELQAGVIGRLRECAAGSQWCEVQAAGYRGYLRRDQIWGLLPDEVLAPS